MSTAPRSRGRPSPDGPRRRWSRTSPELALPRRREGELLHRVVRANLETLLAEASGRGGLPPFVESELRAFVECGVAAHGFMRVRCADCAHDRLVPFSCKRRGFCPSCGGRRMAQQAAHLVDRVLPFVPVRQWVVSLPFALRFRVANDHRLLSAVLAVCLRALLGLQRDRARRILGVTGRCGAVTVVQRFGGALNMNVHFHVMVLDGVHVETGSGRVAFRPLARPTASEVQALVETIARRVRALLRRRGLLEEGEERLTGDTDGEEEAAVLASCRAASARGLSVLAGRSGRGARRVRLPDPEGSPAAPRERTTGVGATAGGFDVHAGASVPPWDRSRLERLCRYALRPPLARGRLREADGGLLSYELAHPWRDGTRAILLEPLELLERLVALVPAPGRNLLRYHGTLAPNSRWRSLIVPLASDAGEGEACARSGESHGRHASGGEGASARGRLAPGARRSDWIPWAELMRRVWAEDVLACPRCGGRMTVIAAVTSAEAIRRILSAPRAAAAGTAAGAGAAAGRPVGVRAAGGRSGVLSASRWGR